MSAAARFLFWWVPRTPAAFSPQTPSGPGPGVRRRFSRRWGRRFA